LQGNREHAIDLETAHRPVRLEPRTVNIHVIGKPESGQLQDAALVSDMGRTSRARPVGLDDPDGVGTIEIDGDARGGDWSQSEQAAAAIARKSSLTSLAEQPTDRIRQPGGGRPPVEKKRR
jgi:hypothetical protein